MNPSSICGGCRPGVPVSLWLVLLVFSGAFFPASADQVQMRNGDRYSGQVMSLNRDTVVVQNQDLGLMRLPRDKVALIQFGTNETGKVASPLLRTNAAAGTPSAGTTNSSPELAAMLRQLSDHSNLVGQVQSKFLAGAGPEANDKFNELLAGLMTGSLSVTDLAAQAKAVADQLRANRKDWGEDGAMIDSYLAILDQFLKQLPPPPAVSTNRQPVAPKPSLPPLEE